MKTLCKLLLLAVLAVAVVGGVKDWYTFRTGRSESGQRQFTLEWNGSKVMSDLAVVKASSRDAIDSALKDEPATPHGIGPATKSGAPAKPAKKVEPNPKVRELEAQRHELASQLEQLKKVPGAKLDAALEVIQQRIDEYDRAIERELSGR